MKNKYINFIPIRHGITCSNLIYWGIGQRINQKMSKNIQDIISKYAPDTDLCQIGIEQCLQLADFLNKRSEEGFDYINGNAMYIHPVNKYKTKPFTLFSCSELRRSQENIYVSLINYLPQYLKDGKKIMIIPWLNEKIEKNDLDNYPETYEERKISWKKFIKNLRIFFKKEMGNMGNKDKKFDIIFEEDWDKIFCFNPFIYEPFLKNKQLNPFSNEGKLFPIPLINLVPGTNKMIPDINNYMENLSNILNEFSGNINLVMVTHVDFETRFLEKIYPKSITSLKKQEVMNCELIKLPRYDLNHRRFLDDNRNFIDYRIFPVGFHSIIIKQPGLIPYSGTNEKIHNYFIFYGSRLNIFFSLYNLIGITTSKINKNSDYFENDDKLFNKNKKVALKKPLKKYFKMYYERQLGNSTQEYYNILEKLSEFYGEKNNYFYNYKELLEKLKKSGNNSRIIGKEKLIKYIFEMCDSELIKIISSLV